MMKATHGKPHPLSRLQPKGKSSSSRLLTQWGLGAQTTEATTGIPLPCEEGWPEARGVMQSLAQSDDHIKAKRLNCHRLKRIDLREFRDLSGRVTGRIEPWSVSANRLEIESIKCDILLW